MARDPLDYSSRSAMSQFGIALKRGMNQMEVTPHELAKRMKEGRRDGGRVPLSADYIQRLIDGEVHDISLYDAVDLFFFLGLKLDINLTTK